MNIIFFGNTKYSIIGAGIINTTYPISFIITKKLAFNPVKQLAEKLNIPVLETDKLDAAVIEKIKQLKPDFLIVEDFGLILPEKLLNIPKYAALNIHHSLLPKYRGPSPVPFAILNGDKITGVSIIKMSERVDAGDILAQKEYTLSDQETTDSLLSVLNKLGGQLLVEVIKDCIEDKTKPVKQDGSQATYTKHFAKEDGYFDISSPLLSEQLDRMIRAYYPWPGVWTKWSPSAKASGDKKGKIVKFLPLIRHPDSLSCHPEPFDFAQGKLREGSLTNVRISNTFASLSAGKLRDSSSKTPQNDKFLIQMEGKKAMPLQDFLNGYPDFPIKALITPKSLNLISKKP